MGEEQGGQGVETKNGPDIRDWDAVKDCCICMSEFDVNEIKLYLSNNYTEPEALIDATKATFLISENIPSPMGAFLSAFKTEAEAQKFQSEQGGRLFNWNQLLAHLNN